MTIQTTFGEAAPTYYVFKEGGDAPRHPHPSRFKAEREAERLAKITPGGVFHVVKLKKTLMYMAAAPAATPKNDDLAMRAAHARQLIGELAIGDRVRVTETHHVAPDAIGTIISMDDTTTVADEVVPTVRVLLDNEEEARRFQPQSLRKLHMYPDDGGLKPQVRPVGAGISTVEHFAELFLGKKPREPRVGDLVTYMERGVERQGEIRQLARQNTSVHLQRYVIRDIIDNILMPQTYERGDIRIDTPIEDRPEEAAKACATDDREPSILDMLFGGLFEAAAAQRQEPPAVEPGSECWIINGHGPFGVAQAFKGKLDSVDSDPTFGWVFIEGREKAAKVHMDRLVALDDPRVHVVSI
jgi:hypothetical protein